MSQHTKGPWHVVEGGTHGSIGVISGETLEMANAQRIAACINACEGFSLEELQGANLFKDSIESDAEITVLHKQRDALLVELRATESRLHEVSVLCATVEQQRDELLEALCDFSEYVHNEQCSTDGAVQYSTTQINRLVFKARAAIAKAKGAV